jgi:hypothetical protein
VIRAALAGVPAPGDTAGPLAGYIAGWRPSSVSPQAAAFARAVITETENRPHRNVKTSTGAGERIRTADLPFTRRLLCLLSYTGWLAEW